jgi:hypothetical protein
MSPWRALRVGITQSNISMPRAILENIFGSTHPHQVTGLVFGQDIRYHFRHGVRFLGWFAHRQPPDGIALSFKGCDYLGRFSAEVGVGTALYNGEKRLRIAVQRRCVVEPPDAPGQPAVGEAERFFGVLVVAG